MLKFFLKTIYFYYCTSDTICQIIIKKLPVRNIHHKLICLIICHVKLNVIHTGLHRWIGGMINSSFFFSIPARCSNAVEKSNGSISFNWISNISESQVLYCKLNEKSLYLFSFPIRGLLFYMKILHINKNAKGDKDVKKNFSVK